jgi:hypothetical protein
MTLDEYRRYYTDFIITILGPSVNREAHCDLKLQKDSKRQAELENWKNGIIVVELVSFIESNFLQKSALKKLRQFGVLGAMLPSPVNQTHLSCFIYLRDCFAHSPTGVLLGPGANTSGFIGAVASGAFPWAMVDGQNVVIVPAGLHELHLIALRFFGEKV